MIQSPIQQLLGCTRPKRYRARRGGRANHCANTNPIAPATAVK
jgi:hypothetical protein